MFHCCWHSGWSLGFTPVKFLFFTFVINSIWHEGTLKLCKYCQYHHQTFNLFIYTSMNSWFPIFPLIFIIYFGPLIAPYCHWEPLHNGFCVILMGLCHFLSTSLFLAQDILGSYCKFPCHNPGINCFSRMLVVLVAIWVLLHTGPLGDRSRVCMCMCVFTLLSPV